MGEFMNQKYKCLTSGMLLIKPQIVTLFGVPIWGCSTGYIWIYSHKIRGWISHCAKYQLNGLSSNDQ